MKETVGDLDILVASRDAEKVMDFFVGYPEVEKIIVKGENEQDLARSAYIAICIDLAAEMKVKYPEKWEKALSALTSYWRVMQNIFYDDEVPRVLPLREKALAGIEANDPADLMRLFMPTADQFKSMEGFQSSFWQAIGKSMDISGGSKDKK